MSHVIRRARDEDHARITEIRNAVSENKLGEAGKNQQNGAKGLENLARKLGHQSEAEQQQLVKRLR